MNAVNRSYILQSDLDEKDKVIIINGLWSLQRTSSLAYTFSFIKKVYQNSILDREDQDSLHSIAYLYALRRNMSINLNLISQQRVSTIDNESYEDFRFILSLNYTSL